MEREAGPRNWKSIASRAFILTVVFAIVLLALAVVSFAWSRADIGNADISVQLTVVGGVLLIMAFATFKMLARW